ncbi:ImpA family metalloprotease [Deefgea tanakiae]|uniref:ImpA family metalloprotease n=1 Tax=Deefgea tanakiae TaxID=2865840 RepID=A0ABX8Z4Y0_9NEIS|nr:ImpA family metalloprotease [Deefgea tanakiae]QZA77372.1 ImpA family metalloprotease [Deefgea tanakiae]
MPKLTRLFFNSVSFLLCSSISFAAPLWQSNTAYQINDIVTFEGRDYKALKGHITNPTWLPSRSPALWVDIGVASAVTAKTQNQTTLIEKSLPSVATTPKPIPTIATTVINNHIAVKAIASMPVSAANQASEIRFSSTTVIKPSNTVDNNLQLPSAPTANLSTQIVKACAAPWSASVLYAAGDVISFGGSNYQANSQNVDKNPKRVSTNILSSKFWKKRKDWKNWRNQGQCSNTVAPVNPDSTTKPIVSATPAVTMPPVNTPTPIVTIKPAGTPTPSATIKPANTPTPTPTEEAETTPIPTTPGHAVTTPTPTEDPDVTLPPTTAPPVITPAPVSDPVKQALSLATQRAMSYQQLQSAVIADIYGDASLNVALNHTTESIEIHRSNSLSAIPFIVADDGSGMAAVSQNGKGRALAYGANVLLWMANQSKETQHLPLFTRAFNWVVTGKASGPLPATLRFTTAGYDAATVSRMITRLGKSPLVVPCNLVDANNTCWQDADLLVFGSGVKDDPALAALVRKYQENGKAIIYMHPNWVESAGGRKVLQGIGMELGGYPGNYYAPLAGVSVGADRSAADSIQKADQMGALVSALTQMADNNPSLNISTETAMTNAISQMQDEMAWMQKRGIDIFTAPNADLHRLLIQWADLYRPSIQYGTIFRTREPAKFLRTYASDSWVAFNRASTTVNATGQGDYMPAVAQTIPVSSTSETIEVTIAQSSGITAIGRGAIPGQPVYIEVVNDGGTSGLNLQTSHVRAYGNPLTDKESEGYKRPREPQSFPIPLQDTGESVFVSPFGGPLFLSYSGATAGQSVTLRIRGAAKYAHFDFTKPQSDADIAEAVAALKRADFGWQTSKFVGGEIQQTIGYAKQAIGNADPKVVIIDQVKGSLFDSNHIANGYNNMPMSNNVSMLCTQFGWDCTGPIHRAPGVQHFIGWIAQCGFLCSGNPSDGFSGIGGTGWGHAHELGHNTVQRVMRITFNGKGCVVECDNNVLASIQMMRQFKTLGIDTGHPTDHPGLYQRIVTNRNSGLTGDAKILDMQTNLWDMNKGQNPMRAVHFQLAFLFSKYRVQEAIPSMETTLDYFTLLTKGDRLVARAWDANSKDKYAMGRFSNNTISNPDLLYVLSSKIIGKDLRTIFAMYGMTVSQTALDSVASLGFPIVSEEFYALASGKHNQPSTGQWVNLTGQTPSYPY